MHSYALRRCAENVFSYKSIGSVRAGSRLRHNLGAGEGGGGEGYSELSSACVSSSVHTHVV